MTDTESKQARASRLIQQEVHACVSNLMVTLASGAGGAPSTTLNTLTKQALELFSPIPGYDAAAFDAGWTQSTAGWFWREPTTAEIEAGTACFTFSGSRIFEHWTVSPGLADELEARGEKVDRNFAGLNVWARATTGQAISIDAVIESIVDEMYAPTPEPL